MIDHSTALLGLPGFRVLCAEKFSSEWYVDVETPRDLVGCPMCGAVAVVKDRRTVATDDICVSEGYSVITWWTGSFGDSTEITARQVTDNAAQYLRAGNIVIGHANFPAVTTVFDEIIRLIEDRGLATVTLADVFAT